MNPSPTASWRASLALGAWLSLVAVWPTTMVQIKFAHLLWQPLLLGSLACLVWARRRQVGWAAAAGHALFFYAFFSMAGWLPWLRESTGHAPYPRAYEAYLLLYEMAIAALIAFQAVHAAITWHTTWWNVNGWSRPLIIAPALLLVRGLLIGHWSGVLGGVVMGLLIACAHVGGRLGWLSGLSKHRRWIPWVVCVVAGIVVYGAAMRIYTQTGPAYPAASDDGLSYYSQAVKMAEHPGWFWTDRLEDHLFFTGYYPLMALWFMVVGQPHLPSWLLWHGVAGGLLAVCLLWIGRRLGGTAIGLVAAGLVIADHIMLHLMATMNMETFFIPALYLMVVLWVRAGERPARAQAQLCFWAGVVLGLATVIRPTSIVMPLGLILLLWVERPRCALKRFFLHGGWMCGGFVIPIGLLLLRNRMAWGHWTLAAQKAQVALSMNPALSLDGQHLAQIGMGRWLLLLMSQPSLIWTQLIPGWGENGLTLWTHRGFGQMDLVQGLNYVGPYQAALTTLLVISVVAGLLLALARRRRIEVTLLLMPVYFSSLVVPFLVLNSRYRSPFIPVLYLLCGLALYRAMAAVRSAGAVTPSAPRATVPPMLARVPG